MDAEQQQRILGYFLQETQEHLATLRQALADMAQPLGDPDQVSDWFRAAHSIKGGAAMLGLEGLQQLALRLEDCFKILRDQGVERQVSLSPDMVALFAQGIAALEGLVNHLEQEGTLPFEMGQQVVIDHEPVFIQLEALLQILVQGEAVMSGWDAAVTDTTDMVEPSVFLGEAAEVATSSEAESEEIDLVGLFASLDAQGTAVPAAEGAESLASVPTNTPQELASLAELFSLAPEEGSNELVDEGGVAGAEQTVEDLGALADLFSLEGERALSESEGFDDLAGFGADAEAMALTALSELQPLSGSESEEFPLASELSGEFSGSFGDSELSFTENLSEELSEVPALDFDGEAAPELGELQFASELS
ncbi:MAG: Hpt domain-containing protein, partial [Gloeomargarita sp. DG02_1_bins_92]